MEKPKASPRKRQRSPPIDCQVIEEIAPQQKRRGRKKGSVSSGPKAIPNLNEIFCGTELSDCPENVSGMDLPDEFGEEDLEKMLFADDESQKMKETISYLQTFLKFKAVPYMNKKSRETCVTQFNPSLISLEC